MKLHHLIYVLRVSIQRNGADKPLTLGHLLNILILARRLSQRMSEKEFEDDARLLEEAQYLFGQM